jgi:hypothetical protein
MWCKIRSEIKATASNIVGSAAKRAHILVCPIIGRLSEQQLELKLQINGITDSRLKADFKKRRNKVQVQIKHRLRVLEHLELNERTSKIVA